QALAVDAATYLVAAALLAGLRPARPAAGAHRTAGPRRARRVVTDLAVGLREFAGRQWLWVVVVSAAFLNAGSSAGFAVLGPVLAAERLGGAVPWSVILAAYTIGMLTSVLAALRVRPARPLRTAALVTPLLAAPLLAMGGGAPLALVTVAAFAAGAALNLFSVLWETTLQQQVPSATLARVTACNYLVALSLKPVAIWLAGHAASGLGAGPAMLCLGAVVLVAGTAALASPQVRDLTDDTRPKQAGTPPDPAGATAPAAPERATAGPGTRTEPR